jgi:hypothetical protein
VLSPVSVQSPVDRGDGPWRPGDKVRWRDRAGVYRRAVDEENAEVVIAERIYRVRRAELQQR